MANTLSPTAANIISSLGVKGATVGASGGVANAGFVPVLDENGKLNVNLIPDDAARLSMSPLANVVFVDGGTSEEDPAKRNGSIAAPYKTISEAASRGSASSDGRIAIVLAPCVYDDSNIVFRGARTVYVIGVGECVLGATSVYVDGLGSGASVFLRKVKTNYELTLAGVAKVTCSDETYISTLTVGSGTKLRISSDSRVGSTDAIDISLSSDAAHVGYDGEAEAPDGTVGAALSGLERRKIRVARIERGSYGLEADLSSFSDISAGSGGGGNAVFDLGPRDRFFASVINDLYERSRNVQANMVNTVSLNVSGTAEIAQLNIGSLQVGGYRLSIDAYGYLVVNDGSDAPPRPPDKIVLLRDTGDQGAGAVYLLGVANGRMYIVPYDDGSSPGGADADQELKVYDTVSGRWYAVSMNNGRLVISVADQGASS